MSLSKKELLLLIKDMIKYGLKGLEVYHSSHNLEDIKFYNEVAEYFGLYISGGSDYHGEITKPNIEIGEINNEEIKSKKLTLLNKII